MGNGTGLEGAVVANPNGLVFTLGQNSTIPTTDNPGDYMGAPNPDKEVVVVEGEMTFDGLKERYFRILDVLNANGRRYLTFGGVLADDFKKLVEQIFPNEVTDEQLDLNPSLKQDIFNKLNSLFQNLEALCATFETGLSVNTNKNQEVVAVPKFSIMVDFILNLYRDNDSFQLLESSANSLIPTVDSIIEDFLSKILESASKSGQFSEDDFINLLNKKDLELEAGLVHLVKKFDVLIVQQLTTTITNINRYKESLTNAEVDDSKYYTFTGVLNNNLNTIYEIVDGIKVGINLDSKNKILEVVSYLRTSISEETRYFFGFQSKLKGIGSLIYALKPIISRDSYDQIVDALDLVEKTFGLYYRENYENKLDSINRYTNQLNSEPVTVKLIGQDNIDALVELNSKIQSINDLTNFNDVDNLIVEYLSQLDLCIKILQGKFNKINTERVNLTEELLIESKKKESGIFKTLFNKAKDILFTPKRRQLLDTVTNLISEITDLKKRIKVEPNNVTPLLLEDGNFLGEITTTVGQSYSILNEISNKLQNPSYNGVISVKVLELLDSNISKIENFISTNSYRVPESLRLDLALIVSIRNSLETDIKIKKLQARKSEIIALITSPGFSKMSTEEKMRIANELKDIDSSLKPKMNSNT